MAEAEEKGKKPDTKNTGDSKAATRAKNKFNRNNYERLYPFVKLGEKARIEKAASAAGQSINDYVVTAVYQRMEREGHGGKPDGEGGTIKRNPADRENC